MMTAISKIFVTVATKLFYAFFTEKLLSKLIVELLWQLAKRTDNTIDDAMVQEIADNLNIR